MPSCLEAICRASAHPNSTHFILVFTMVLSLAERCRNIGFNKRSPQQLEVQFAPYSFPNMIQVLPAKGELVDTHELQLLICIDPECPDPHKFPANDITAIGLSPTAN
jgi:hypothetical protein